VTRDGVRRVDVVVTFELCGWWCAVEGSRDCARL
jgi:hypothetical protein